MSPPTTPHLDPTDLANLAREKLGQKKTQRLLDHCKECPDCADQLLEAVREQPSATGRPALSKWNWISIGVLIVALLAVVAALWWILRSASRSPATGFELSQVAQPLRSRDPLRSPAQIHVGAERDCERSMI
jgi:hypothetical protein